MCTTIMFWQHKSSDALYSCNPIAPEHHSGADFDTAPELQNVFRHRGWWILKPSNCVRLLTIQRHKSLEALDSCNPIVPEINSGAHLLINLCNAMRVEVSKCVPLWYPGHPIAPEHYSSAQFDSLALALLHKLISKCAPRLCSGAIGLQLYTASDDL